MEKYKIYRKDNYIQLETQNGLHIFTGHVKDVKVISEVSKRRRYRFYGISKWNPLIYLSLSQILDENGDNYSLSGWEDFFTKNTGNFDEEVVIPPFNPSLYDLSEFQNGDADKFIRESDLAAYTKVTTVANYSALPDPTTVPGEMYIAENSQGTNWLPGSLGGTYYPEGEYYSNGVKWIYQKSAYQATQMEVDAGLNTDKFVTPKTLTDSAQLNAKANISGQVFTGNISAPKVDVITPAVAGVEILQQWQVDDADSYVRLENVTSSSTQFIPSISFYQPSLTSNFAAIITSRVIDTGTQPSLVIDSRTMTNTALVNRPVLRIRNYSTQIIDVTATGSVGINTTSPTERLDVNGSIRTRDSIIFSDTAKSIDGGVGAVMTINSGINPMIFRQTANPFMRGTTAGVGIEIAGTPTIDASAILTLTSTSKGFLPPRMTTAQRDAITSPALGLMIYNTSTNKHQGYNGTWNDLY